MRFREVQGRIYATFRIRDNAFIAVPVLFDRSFDPAIHTLGFIIPLGGRQTYAGCSQYSVIILQQVGEERFERAGILDLSCSSSNGTLFTRLGPIIDAQDRWITEEVYPIHYLFLHGSKTRSFWFV
jgi:hypothetical protein